MESKVFLSNRSRLGAFTFYKENLGPLNAISLAFRALTQIMRPIAILSRWIISLPLKTVLLRVK